MVVQPGPLQHGFWSAVTKGFTEPLEASEETLTAFRRLMALFMRRRQERHEQAFVKFISWNALYVDFIMKAFPNVPATYLYRDPIEIIASVRKSSTAVLEAKDSIQAELLTNLSRAEIDQLGTTAYLAYCYREAFSAIIAHRNGRLSLVDYDTLTSARLAEILDHSFDYRPSTRSLAKMLAQFATYSKDDTGTASFTADGDCKHATISEDDRRLISDISGMQLNNLRLDSRNIFPPLSPSDQQNAPLREPHLTD